MAGGTIEGGKIHAPCTVWEAWFTHGAILHPTPRKTCSSCNQIRNPFILESIQGMIKVVTFNTVNKKNFFVKRKEHFKKMEKEIRLGN